MKKLTNRVLAMLMMVCMLMITQSAVAQQYSVSYENQPIEKVLKDLRSRTGYEFVYQKHILNDVPNITGSFKNLNLTQLLNRIIIAEANLDYEIVKKNIILKKAVRLTGNNFKKNIVGIITDENGDPMMGASIRQCGTTNGCTADADGAFSLIVEGNAPEIEVSFIGYLTNRVKISGKTPNLHIKMVPNETQLDNVIVTGYQNIKRENATGSYQLITNKALDKRHTSSIVENLEGQIPGLVSYNNGLDGNGESALKIRGTSSFNARTSPLVVVDGLPIEGSIETINPYNIQSITVLKDAAAVSIYGARASNGVIVVTTKRANQERVEIDFNADLTISEKQKYDNFNYISAQELIQLEKYNFAAMRDDSNQKQFNDLIKKSTTYYQNLSPVTRLLLANHQGTLTDAAMNAQLDALGKNDYRQEWIDAYKRTKVEQQYNLGIRTRGKSLASNIELNYKGNNLGNYGEHDNYLTFSYRGDLNLNKWLNFTFGTNVINQRSKTHWDSYKNSYYGMNAYQPYMSMYDAQGNPVGLEGEFYVSEKAFEDKALGLKNPYYNPIQERDMNYSNYRNTNIRSFVSGTVNILPGWSATAHFQYEDITAKRNTLNEAESYYMRSKYNLYTMKSGSSVTHYIPEGSLLTTSVNEQAHYTFRAQTAYAKTFAERHAVDAVAGFEFRENHTKTYSNILLGYDDQTQTNSNGIVDFNTLKGLSNKASVIGNTYKAYGAPDANSFTTSDILHRFYSLYFSGNYTYDSRYSASFSYRVDKTDLFGADPEFRGRPLWSVGGSWNIHNEAFMKQYEWLDALKLRASYGLTGNIDSSVSSYLTAKLENDYIYNNIGATLETPPNDQLRWEKTASFNVGLDFSVLQNKLSGSIDYYHKKGTDLLTTTDLDPTTGWTQLTINNGEMVNKGIELQLNGVILRPATRNDLGINASFNLAYNKNEVTSVNHKPTSGHENLRVTTLHEGYPVHSLFSYRYAGIKHDKGSQYIQWTDRNGEIHATDVSASDFTIEDAVFSGSLDPKIVSSFTPQISFRGFTLSAMFSYFAGHYMRVNASQMTTAGSNLGYSGGNLTSNLLNYWTCEDKTQYLGNGYLANGSIVGYNNTQYMDSNVVPADYLKIRNIVLGYDFPANWCRTIGINSLRLRAQVNNVGTWARNSYGIDPEANNPVTGTTMLKPCRSYTMSLHINF